MYLTRSFKRSYINSLSSFHIDLFTTSSKFLLDTFKNEGQEGFAIHTPFVCLGLYTKDECRPFISLMKRYKLVVTLDRMWKPSCTLVLAEIKCSNCVSFSGLSNIRMENCHRVIITVDRQLPQWKLSDSGNMIFRSQTPQTIHELLPA